jgi:integrase
MARIKVKKNISYDEEKCLYYVSMDYGNDYQGKRIRKYKVYKSKAEANRALKKFEANKTKQTLVLPTLAKLDEWLHYWLEDVKSMKCEETTLYGYRNIIHNHINPYLGNIKLQELNTPIINKYFMTLLKEGFSKNTIRKHYDLLKDALRYAVVEDKLVKNPMDKIEPIRKENKEKMCYNLEQLKQLFKVVENDRMEIVVKLAGYLGLRREEICGLKWENIDIEDGKITICIARTQAGGKTIEKGTKNKSSYRTLYAPEDLIELLSKVKAQQVERMGELGSAYKDEDFVVAWENGKPYRPNYLSELFKKVIDNNELEPISLHNLRHSFASICNDLGINIHDISKALGHSHISTTSAIYTHMFDKTHKKAISRMADNLK